MAFSKQSISHKKPKAFTILEVLVALSILTVMLIAIYQSFSTSIFILSSTTNLWRSMTHSQNELLKWERSVSAPISVAQGEFEEDHPMWGFRWERKINDISPLPGIQVRKVAYRLMWNEGKNEYSYHSEI